VRETWFPPRERVEDTGGGRVKRLLAGFAFGVTLATLGFLLVRLAAPGRHELELDVYVLAVGALAVLELVLATRTAYPRECGSALAEALGREPPRNLRPPELERLEREVSLATSTAFDLHYRLCPALREVALQRLADHRGLELDAGGGEVEEALGEELWELVRSDRDPPADRYGPGISTAGVRRAVERLEAL
jgi:hypothetical protein